VRTQLTPAVDAGALKNDKMRTSIYNMAKEAGYAGPNSLKPLRDWFDRNKMSAQDATTWVHNFNNSLSVLNGKKVSATVVAHAIGQGLVSFTEKGLPSNAQGFLSFHAKGALIGGQGNADTVPAMLTPGETVVPKHLTPLIAPLMAKHGVPGFASGGLIPASFGTGLSNLSTEALNLQGWTAAKDSNFVQEATSQFMSDAVKAAKASIAKAVAAAKAFGAGPGGGAPGANAALARKLMPAWGSGAEWNAWNALEMMEAGWNQFARNPSSGAYGIPQALPPGKMGPAANPPQSNPTAQIRWMISYIQGRYGDPLGAVAHENAFHWYAKGGLVGGHNGLNNRIDRVMRFINRHPDDPATYTNLELQLEAIHGKHPAERKRLEKELKPYVETRHWVSHIMNLMGARDKTFGTEAGNATKHHQASRAAHFNARISSDKLESKTMGSWLNRLINPETRSQKNADTAWVDSLITGDLRKLGLPVISFDSGGWLQPGATLALNNTGKAERISSPSAGSTPTITVNFGNHTPPGQLERAIWDFMLHNVDIKGGGDVQVALGRKA
jgi:hypothetical protein